jgi:hypothetical protein
LLLAGGPGQEIGVAVRERKRIGVVLPVGPKDVEAALDTLASALYYLDESRIIVAVDDSGRHPEFAARVRELSEEIVVLPAPRRAPGGFGGLYVKIASGYQWLLEHYHPDIVLRLDTDALIIGRGLEDRAAREFAENPETGLLGAYRIDPNGQPRDWSWAARRLHIEQGVRGLRHPRRWRRLRLFTALAAEHGYVAGEHVLGGGYIHSFEAAYAIYLKGWFNQPCLATSKLGEDHIMGLFAVAAGYRIADFARPEDPMAVKWRGLPAHPDDLLANKKLITHSVRSWGTLREPEIRAIFRSARD